MFAGAALIKTGILYVYLRFSYSAYTFPSNFPVQLSVGQWDCEREGRLKPDAGSCQIMMSNECSHFCQLK